MYQQDLTITVTGGWRKKEVQSRHELATYRDVLMSPFKNKKTTKQTCSLISSD
jgi:hypothetical protein